MASPYRLGLAVLVVVLAITSSLLYVKVENLQDMLDHAKTKSHYQAYYAMNSLLGDFGNIQKYASENETLLVHVTLYHIRDCSQVARDYFELLYMLTGNRSYLRAANSLDELSIWAQNTAQELIPGGQNASVILEKMSSSQEVKSVYDALKSVRDSMRGAKDPSPEACEKLADSIEALTGSIP